MNPDGTCPQCGESVESAGHVKVAETRKAPWHFKLMVGVISIYLAYRLVQLVLWII